MAGFVAIPLKTMFDDSGLKHAASAFGKFGGTIKGILGAAGLSIGISALVSGINSVSKAAVDDAKSMALLRNQMVNSVGATQAMSDAAEASITKMSLLASVADDKIRPAFAQLIRSTKDVGKATELTQLALDISGQTGKDLTSVTTALSKAYQGNLGGLQKLGIKVKDTKHPFRELEKAFKDGAKTAANTDPYQRMAVVFDEIKETIGRAFIPALNDLADWFTNNFAGIQKFFSDAMTSKPFKDLQEIGGRLWNEVLVPLGEWFMSADVQKGINNVFEGISNVVTAALDFAKSDLGKFLLALTDAVLITGLNALGAALKGIADAIERLSGKAIYQGIDKAYTAYGTIRQGNTQGTTFVGGGNEYVAGAYGIGGTPTMALPKMPSFGGTGGIPRQTINQTITVNGVIGDKAAVAKEVVRAIQLGYKIGISAK